MTRSLSSTIRVALDSRKTRRAAARKLALLLVLASSVAAPQAGAEVGLQYVPVPAVETALPPLPPTTLFPVQLVVDDDAAEGVVGVAGQTARQFLWFNRFTPGVPFSLEEVWVLFTPGPNMALGNAIQLAIYSDADGNPANGATLLASFNQTILALDGNTFSVYPLPAPVDFDGVGDLLIGVIPRFIVSGVTSPTQPASIDTTASEGRSWIGVWSTDPPDPPVLVPPPDQQISTIDGFLPGNWMVRGFGTPAETLAIPTLGGGGLLLLAGLLALAAGAVLRRRARGAALLALALAVASPALPAVAQTNIDTFTTNQATLSAPPDSSSTATGGADIIGTRRGLVARNLTGVGPTTAGVTGGSLTLLVTNTTPDSRGEARLSWDNDTAPGTLNPTGLGGVNLTTGGASGFRIRVNSASVAGSEIEMVVHSNATSSSRASLVLPLVAAPQNFVLPFSEFIQAGTSAANFASVGAIEMTVRSREGTVVLDEVVTALPVIAATKADALVIDNDSDTKADPGDRVRYTVTITNTGSEGISVDLTDTVDSNTTLVGGSVSSTPVAKNDQYTWFGNVTLTVDGTPFPALLANDTDPDGDTVTISAFDATTAQGGSVTGVNVNTGEFTYNPPAGFRGVDSFNYTIVDNDAHTSVASARITLEGIVWFVDDSNTTPPHLGTLSDPFQSLASLGGSDPDAPGDILFIFDDDGTPYAGGLVLEANQTLLGEAEGLVLGGQTIVPAGGRPQITNAAGVGLTLATANTVRGLDVQATSGAGIAGTSFGTLTASNVNVISAGGAALDLATGNLAATFGTLSSSGTGGQRGIQLVTVTGSLTVTTTSLTNPTTQGIRVASSPAVVLDFGNTTITDSAVGSGATAIGIDVATGNAGASFTFDSLAVTTDAGAGLLANGSGTVNIGGVGNTINATGGAAVDITSTSLGSGATFSTLTSTNSAGKGVNLDTVTGSFTATGGSISGPAGIGFDLNAGSANVTYAGSLSNTANNFLIEVTGRTGGTASFSGNLSGTSNSDGIRVANNNVSGSPVINFSGATKTLNTGASAAVTLDNNDVATINFTGGALDIDTTSGIGFNAINGAVGITVQGSGNTIDSGSGTALNVVATTIAAADLNFQSISANGAASGIVLNATGASGNLLVTGTGAANSGGTIQNSTSHGVSLTNTLAPSFTSLRIQNSAGSGVFGTLVNGFSYINGLIDNSGTGLAAEASNIAFNTTAAGTENNLSGTVTITGNTLTNAYYHGVDIFNFSGTIADATISGNTITSTNSTATSKGSGIRFIAFGSAATIANVTRATIANNIISNFPSATGIMAQGGNGNAAGPAGVFGTAGSGSDIIAITGNRVAGFSAANRLGTQAILAVVNGKGQGNFNVSSNGTVANPLTNSIGTTIAVSSLGQAVVTATVSSNVIVSNNAAGANGIGAGTSQTFGATDTPSLTVTISNNQISQTDGNGILATARDATGTLRAKIQNNTVAAPLAGNRNGIRIDAGNAVSINDSVCLNISGNTTAGVGLSPEGIGLRKQGTVAATNNFALHGFATSPANQAQTAAYVTGQNPGSSSGTLIIAGDNFNSPTCSFP